MPLQWTARAEAAAPLAELHLWPHRSLPRRGFVWFIGISAALIAVPLLENLGSAAFWVLLPFLAASLGGVWLALARSYRDGELLEHLRLWPDRVELTRHNPRGKTQEWSANPHWVTLQLYQTEGPVPAYLTLKGGGREVEIGAFLTDEERSTLYPELQGRLAALRGPDPAGQGLP